MFSQNRSQTFNMPISVIIRDSALFSGVTRALIGGVYILKRNTSGRTRIYEYTPPINALVTPLALFYYIESL